MPSAVTQPVTSSRDTRLASDGTSPPPLQSLDFPDAEIVLGMVAPVGTDLEAVRHLIRDHMKQFNYMRSRFATTVLS